MGKKLRAIFLTGTLALAAGVPPRALAIEAARAVGEVRHFWVRDFSVSVPSYRQTAAVLQLVGPRSYIYVEKGKTAFLPNTVLMRFFQRLELKAPSGSFYPSEGVIGIEEKLFAPLPSVVNSDSRLTVLFADLGAPPKAPTQAYFDPTDQLSEREARDNGLHSNESNLIYVSIPRVGEEGLSALVARELQQLLAYHPAAHGSQDPWYESILGEAALLVTGHYGSAAPVNEVSQSSGDFPLVSGLPRQNGTQTLFAAFLLDSMEKKDVGLPFLTRMSREGKEALELFFQQSSHVPITFDVIFNQFLRYVFEHQGAKLPLSLSLNDSRGLLLPPILPYAKIKSFPAQLEGEIAPYSFVAVDLPEALPPTSLLTVEALPTGPCARSAKTLWKPVHRLQIAVYAVGCEQKTPRDLVQFRLRVLDKPSLLPPSPLKLGL